MTWRSAAGRTRDGPGAEGPRTSMLDAVPFADRGVGRVFFRPSRLTRTGGPSSHRGCVERPGPPVVAHSRPTSQSPRRRDDHGLDGQRPFAQPREHPTQAQGQARVREELRRKNRPIVAPFRAPGQISAGRARATPGTASTRHLVEALKDLLQGYASRARPGSASPRASRRPLQGPPASSLASCW